jgi:hypothetical protein
MESMAPSIGYAFYSNAGLTVGSPFTANEIAVLQSNGFNLTSGKYQLNGTAMFDHGTWLPDLQFGGANTGITWGIRYGNWTRSGYQVNVSFVINPGSIGTSTGNATICGLPFPTTATHGNQGMALLNNAGGVNGGAVGNMVTAWMDSSNLSCLQLYAVSSTTSGPLTNTNFASSVNLQGWFSYMTGF